METFGDISIWKHKQTSTAQHITTHHITNTLTLGNLTPTSVIDLELLRFSNKDTYDNLNHAKSNTQSISPHVSRYTCTTTLPNRLAQRSLANGI